MSSIIVPNIEEERKKNKINIKNDNKIFDKIREKKNINFNEFIKNFEEKTNKNGK